MLFPPIGDSNVSE